MAGRRSPAAAARRRGSRLFTVCPKCTLTLVVTTVDLRAGQGYVRCGRCANVFNALVALREGDPASGIADSGTRRLLETAPPKPPAQPALGAGVAVDPEPEPEPEPAPAPEPEPEIDLAAELNLLPDSEAEVSQAPAEGEIVIDEGQPAEAAAGSMEFDAAATDVSEIFITPSEAEHDTGSGSYEAVVLAVDPQPEPAPQPTVDEYDESHTDTIAADDWSLLDDDDPPADAESVIEESPLAQEAEPEPEPEADTQTQEAESGDPAWVQQMFAEAEADAIRSRTGERKALTPPADETDDEEPAVVRAARDVKGVSAASGDTVLEPLLGSPVRRRPPWQYITAVAALSLVLLLQIVHHNRQALVLSPSLGPMLSKMYGLFGVTLMPRWDLTAYSVMQRGVTPDGTRLRVRLSVQNDSDRVQPLPLVRLTLKDRFGKPVATRDLTPADYLPPRAAGQRLLEPDQRIDAELHVMDPGQSAEGFEIDACLRAENGTVGCANDVRKKPSAS